MGVELIRLGEVRLADIVALHNDPRVLRHMPLAGGTFDESECRKWVESKERQWDKNGYGPWGILINGMFAGWGGLQLEMGDADLALVLSPEYWGYGRVVYKKIIKIAFEEMDFESITALLPPTRVHANGMHRLGFQLDGEVWISESKFYRYRLWAPHCKARQSAVADAETDSRIRRT